MLTKYPVSTQHNDYRVDVIKSYCGLGAYQWVANVYLKNNGWFSKWKSIYRFDTGWGNFDDWTGHYVELAKRAVNEYEKEQREKLELEKKHKQGIEEWGKWDGNM